MGYLSVSVVACGVSKSLDTLAPGAAPWIPSVGLDCLCWYAVMMPKRSRSWRLHNLVMEKAARCTCTLLPPIWIVQAFPAFPVGTVLAEMEAYMSKQVRLAMALRLGFGEE